MLYCPRYFKRVLTEVVHVKVSTGDEYRLFLWSKLSSEARFSAVAVYCPRHSTGRQLQVTLTSEHEAKILLSEVRGQIDTQSRLITEIRQNMFFLSFRVNNEAQVPSQTQSMIVCYFTGILVQKCMKIIGMGLPTKRLVSSLHQVTRHQFTQLMLTIYTAPKIPQDSV